ncbi:hypothetical protein TorRG33x02_057450 [Trema orientale]|uniref:Uncharacterized protein n=1 Tax=Trema orientale TaxID=63057 RepID=A0A2P5FL45_TREOI|nr:hypothetical protein TorRG33x02_057450 [Trema orientale]
MLNFALLCANLSRTLRLLMSSVVAMLQGKIQVQVPLVRHSPLDLGAGFKALDKLTQDSQTDVSSYSLDDHDQIIPSTSSSVYLKSKDDKQDSSPSSKLLNGVSDNNTE